MRSVHARSVTVCVSVCVCPSPALHSSHLRSPDGSQLSFTSCRMFSAFVFFLAECELFCWMNQEWCRGGVQGGVEVRVGGELHLQDSWQPCRKFCRRKANSGKAWEMDLTFSNVGDKRKKEKKESMNGAQAVLQHSSSVLLSSSSKTHANQWGLFIITLLCNYSIWIMAPAN